MRLSSANIILVLLGISWVYRTRYGPTETRYLYKVTYGSVLDLADGNDWASDLRVQCLVDAIWMSSNGGSYSKSPVTPTPSSLFQLLFTMGYLRFLCQINPPPPEWSVDDISDLSGKVFVVTGGNSGIGKETCKQLLLKNAKVYLAARSETKAKAAIAELEEQTGRKAIFHGLDLGDLDAVEKSAWEFLAYVFPTIVHPVAL